MSEFDDDTFDAMLGAHLHAKLDAQRGRAAAALAGETLRSPHGVWGRLAWIGGGALGGAVAAAIAVALSAKPPAPDRVGPGGVGVERVGQMSHSIEWDTRGGHDERSPRPYRRRVDRVEFYDPTLKADVQVILPSDEPIRIDRPAN
jgi:hypothetical protein